MLERFGGIVAHGHPDVVAAKSAFAFGSEINDKFVARKSGMTNDIQGVDTGDFNRASFREGTTALAGHHDLAAALAVGVVLAAGEIHLGETVVHERRSLAGFGIDIFSLVGEHRCAPVAFAVLFRSEEVGKLLPCDTVFFLTCGGIAG